MTRKGRQDREAACSPATPSVHRALVGLFFGAAPNIFHHPMNRFVIGIVLRTITSSYQPILEVDSCAAMSGLIASREHLFDTCLAANSGALDAALICASLDIVDHELARFERFRLYATLLSDWQTITLLDAVLNDMMEVKHRLTGLMGRYVHLDTDWEPESNPVPGETCVDSESPAGPAVSH
jgi:hypothetical protein